MKQRGRKSAENLVTFPVIEGTPRLTAPSGLTKPERALFAEIAVQAPHLRQSDALLLASLVQATTVARKAARDVSRADTWERAVRLQAMLSTKLRLTAQARMASKTVGRQQDVPMSYYDQMRLEREANDPDRQ